LELRLQKLGGCSGTWHDSKVTHQESGRRVKADTARARMGESDREETGGGLAFDPWDTKSADVGHDGIWNRRPGTEVRRRQGRKRPLRPGKLRGRVGYMSRGSQPTGLSVTDSRPCLMQSS